MKYVSLLFNNVTRTGYELIYKYKYNFPANLVVDTQARLIVEVTRRSLHFQSGEQASDRSDNTMPPPPPPFTY